MDSFGSLSAPAAGMPAGAQAGESVGFAEGEAQDIFASYPSAVAALSAQTASGPVGFVVTSFTAGISFDPPMAIFSAQNSSQTWKILREAPSIGVSILGSDQQHACYQLASRSKNRFEHLQYRVTSSGAVLLADSPLHLECEVLSETPAGDHQVVLLEVKGAEVRADVSPLVYRSRGFHHLVAAG